MNLYFQYNYIPAPHSIYKEIKKIKPGQAICFDFKNDIGSPKEFYQWSAENVANESKKNIIEDKFAGERLIEKTLEKTVQSRLISDVPIGCFLSGGIDSSLVAALIQKNSTKPLKTFSIGFEFNKFNEAKYANKISKYLNTEHFETYVTAKDCLNIIPRISDIYGEPFADSSQIPTILLSQIAKKEVTVSLTGDAGDELFGGYNRYFWASRLRKVLNFSPKYFTKSVLKSFLLFNKKIYNFDNLFKINNLSSKIQKVLNVANYKSNMGFYSELLTQSDPQNFLSKEFLLTHNLCLAKEYDKFSFEENMMINDTKYYLPGDILTKVDRAAMYSSLETRVPFLGNDIFKAAWQIRNDQKFYRNEGKIILKNILAKYIPKKLFDRPKMGFGIPIQSWITGSLNNWIEDLLEPKKIKQQGFFDTTYIENVWKNQKNGLDDNSYHLWTIIIFQDWLQKNKIC